MLFIFSLFRSHHVSLAFQYELHNFRHKFKTLIDLLKQVKNIIFFRIKPSLCIVYIYKWTVVSLVVSNILYMIYILHYVIEKVVNTFNSRKLKVSS